MTWGQLALDAAKTVLPFAAAAATGLLAKGWQSLISWEKSLKLTQNSQLNADLQDTLIWATNEAHTAVDAAVNMVNQTLTNSAKAANAGHLTAETAVQAFQTALHAAEGALSATAKATITQQIGDLPTYLTTLIEAYVPLAPTRYHAASEASAPAADATAQ